MPETKALFTAQFDAARTAWTKKDEPAAAEFLRSAIITARSEPSLRRELASALFHLGKLSQKLGRAEEAEAEPLLTEALAISEGLFGRESAALTPVLNELGRLHFHRSQYARAADVLERLLAIARGKSDENADVATVLAGLAVVKRKLGDDAAAEALYRDALRIREKVLEPSHMATVVTRECLSETCAARGNLREALPLLRLALATREAALGPRHATVQAARSRVAELELQVAVADGTAAAAAAKAAQGLGESGPRVLPLAARLSERAKTPTVTAAVAGASWTPPSIQTWSGSASQIVISAPPPKSAGPSGSITGRESGAMCLAVVPADGASSVVASGDVASGDVASGGVASGGVALGAWRSAIARVRASLPELTRKKRTTLYSSAGVAAVIIAIELLIVRPRAGSGKEPVSTEKSAAPHSTAGALVVTAPPSTAPAPTTPVKQIEREQRMPASAPPEFRSPRVDIRLNSVNIPSVPAPPSADAILRSATERQRTSDTNRAETSNEPSRPRSLDIVTAHTSPKIIGRVPDPGFPDALLRHGRREGQVVVRFMVNELGRVDVASMIVEQSDDDLFTEAVRDVLPLFRFEPARTLGLEASPVAAWVSVPFRFTARKIRDQ
jgi:TonB family protein